MYNYNKLKIYEDQLKLLHNINYIKIKKYRKIKNSFLVFSSKYFFFFKFLNVFHISIKKKFNLRLFFYKFELFTHKKSQKLLTTCTYNILQGIQWHNDNNFWNKIYKTLFDSHLLVLAFFNLYSIRNFITWQFFCQISLAGNIFIFFFLAVK